MGGSGMKRLIRVGKKLASLDFSDLAFSLWLRYKGIEFSGGQYIPRENGNPHGHSGGPKLEKVLKSMSPSKCAVALDLGSGAGIAALTMSRYFRRVIGIELSEELTGAARRNIERVGVKNIELVCMDAREYTTNMDEYVTHVYIFNSFGPSVMEQVIDNLRTRRLTVIYKYPVCPECVTCCEIIRMAGFRKQRTFRFRNSHPFDVYVN